MSGVRDYRLEGRNVFVKLGLSFGGRRGFDLGFLKLWWVCVAIACDVRTLDGGWGRSGVLGVRVRGLIEDMGRGAGERCG